jgi:hypothetical protein
MFTVSETTAMSMLYFLSEPVDELVDRLDVHFLLVFLGIGFLYKQLNR